MSSKSTNPEFIKVYDGMSRVFEEHAVAWDQQRPKVLFEKKWLDKFITYLPAGANVLDLGCGAGEPIFEYLVQQGLKVTGVDYSQGMLQIARPRFPDCTFIRQDMRELNLDQKFHGIVGWDSFFHLSQEEQRAVLVRIIQHLKDPCVILLTVGDQAGEVLGKVDGQDVYHSSLSEEEYRSILSDHGFKAIDFVACDKECGEHTMLLAHMGS